jgi:hypothetical protein
MKEILYEKVEQSLVEKEYDPHKARKLADWNSSDHSSSLINDTETLYMTDDGDYFIFYEGGLHSRFHELPGVTTWFGGTYIRPVTVEDALAWCQETGNYDAIKKHFPFFILSISKKH